MARTAPAPNIPPIPGMCPSILVAAGGSDSGGSGGRGAGTGGAGGPGSGGGAGDGTGGDGKEAPDPKKYPLCGTKSHPVDVVTGRAFTHPIVDFETSGPIPFVFERSSSSKLFARDMGMGPSWGHTLGWQIEVRRDAVWVFTDLGTKVAFPLIAVGDDVLGPFGWKLKLDQAGYEVDADDGLYRRFAAMQADEYRTRLIEIRDRNHNKISLSYDTKHCLEQVTDSGGRPIRVKCDDKGHILAFMVQKTPGEWVRLAEYLYDDRGRLVRATDADGHSHHYGYNDRNQLTLDQDRSGLRFHFRFDEKSRCIESWGDYGDNLDPSLAEGLPAFLHDGVTRCKGIHHCIFEWGEDGHSMVTDSTQSSNFFGNKFGLIDKMVEAGGVTTATYRADGHLLSITDGEGATDTYERDARGRILTAVDALGRKTTIERDGYGLPLRVVDPAGNTTVFVRDRRGNVETVQDAGGAFSTIANDSRGLPIKVGEVGGLGTTFEYDSQGNLVATTQSDGTSWRYSFDMLGRSVGETDPMGHQTTHNYSARGDLISTQDALGGLTRYSYDGEQQLIEVVSPSGYATRLTWGGYHRLCATTDANGETVRFGYNTEGELTHVWNEKNELHRLEYTPGGRLRAERTFDGVELRYRHDKAGRPIEIQKGDGKKTELAYDLTGQLIAREYDDGTGDVFSYDVCGRLVGVKSAGGVELRFERDAMGRTVSETQILRGAAQEVASVYDPTGIRLRCTTSLGHVEEVARNPSGLRRVTSLDGTTVAHVTDRLGREVRRDLPGGGQIESSYDPLGRLGERRAINPRRATSLAIGRPDWVGAQPQGITAQTIFRYNSDGALQDAWDAQRGGTEYKTDPVGQLLAVVPARARAELFRYDPAGNLFETGPDAPTRHYGPGNRLLRRGNVEYLWDNDGKVLEKRVSAQTEAGQEAPSEASWRYTWSDAGMMARAESSLGLVVEFVYDAFGRRLEKTVRQPGSIPASATRHRVRFVWDGEVLIHEIREEGVATANSAVEERTYCFDDATFEPLAHREKRTDVAGSETGSWFHYVNDPVGTPERLVDDQGNIACELVRNAWGEMGIVGTPRTTTPLRFQGQYADEETALVYNRFRYYDNHGEFISRDPTRLAGGLHQFGYVSSPYDWVDPRGLVKKGVGTYSGGGGKGGHHIHSQAAMKADPNYSKYSAICISDAEMAKKGIDHQLVTNKQRDCYAEMKAGITRKNTMAEHDRIAKESLIAGGATPAYAQQLVNQSKAQLKSKKVKKGRAWGT